MHVRACVCVCVCLEQSLQIRVCAFSFVSFDFLAGLCKGNGTEFKLA